MSGDPRPTPKVIVELLDGRQIDITHLSPGEALDRLEELGIGRDDIKNIIYHGRWARPGVTEES